MLKAYGKTFSITKVPDFTHVNTDSSPSRLEVQGHPFPHNHSRNNSESLCVPLRHR